MSFGLINALATFIDLMNRVFQQYLNMFVIVFIDDILIYSRSEEDNDGHFRIVLKTLKDRQLFTKFSKCGFCFNSNAFLRNIISSEGMQVDSQKIEVVTNWPSPTTPTYIRSVLGLITYYRRFVEAFSSIAVPFTRLTQKKAKFEWYEVYEKSLQDLNARLNFAPVLTLPEGTNDFVVYCNASRAGLGYVLMLNGKVIAYVSQQLKTYEKRYPTLRSRIGKNSVCIEDLTSLSLRCACRYVH